MSYKFLPILISTLLASAGPKYFYENQDVYKVTDDIWMKNLYFRSGNEMGFSDAPKVITFDIVFHTTSVPYDICANIKETDNKSIIKPSFTPDYRKGMQYQPIQLKLSSSFTTNVSKNELVTITYGDTILFSFNSPYLVEPINVFSYESIDELPSNLLYKVKINLPRIKNSRIEYYYYEYIDLNNVKFDAITNYYYGKFPHEYIWVKFKTDLYDNSFKLKNLKAELAEYNIVSEVYFYETELFEEYYKEHSSSINNPYYDFFVAGSEEINNYYQMSYPNAFIKRTFKSGIMRKEASLSEYELKNTPNKLSKFITYPLDEENYEKNYNLAKNMEMKIYITAGIYQNFQFSVRLTNNLKDDFYYNHSNQVYLNGAHRNPELETVDIMYA